MPSSYLQRQLRTYDEAARDRADNTVGIAPAIEAMRVDTHADLVEMDWDAIHGGHWPIQLASPLAQADLIIRIDDILAGEVLTAAPVEPSVFADAIMTYISVPLPNCDQIAMLLQPVQPL